MRRYLVLAVATTAAFGDSIRGSYHFDDYAMLQKPGGPTLWLQTRPITQITFWLNHLVSGNDASSYHLLNLLVHMAVVCLLFKVLLERLPLNVAFVATVIFAIHPIQSEAVAYIFARSTLLATMFCLLSWLAWSRGRNWFSVLFFGAALLCKEECVTFPLVLFFLGPRRLRPLIAMLAMALVVGLHTVWATRMVAGSGAGFTSGITPLAYFCAEGVAILRYFRLNLIPWGFTIDPTIPTQAWEQSLAWLALAAITLALRKNRWFVAGLLLLIPSSSIFPAADLAADRRMYLPMLAFSVVLAMLAEKIKAPYLIAAGLILVALSISRMEVWRTERSLWQEAVDLSPSKQRPAIQLSRAVPTDEALAVLDKFPPSEEILTERGRVFLELGKPADALREFGRALALAPNDAHAINNRGVALLALGQSRAAKKDFERALQLEPSLQDAEQNLRRATAGLK